MKRLLLIALMLWGVAQAQTPPANYTKINSRYQWLAGQFQALSIPAYGDTSLQSAQWRIAGGILVDTTGSNKGVYVWYDNRWNLVGSGTGTANLNFGSGYRLVVPNTGNIKTLFPGLYMLADSTTNTNALTFKVDTAIMFPQIRSTIAASTVTPPGNNTNLIINRNGSFAAPGSDSLKWDANGLTVSHDVTLRSLRLPLSTASVSGMYVNGTRWFSAGMGSGAPDNLYFGHLAGPTTSSSTYGNTFIGREAGLSFVPVDGTQDNRNIAIGYQAMRLALGGINTIAIGSNALENIGANTSSNIAIGKIALQNCTSCGSNAVIGASTNLTTGQFNAWLGSDILQHGTTASNNALVGYQAMRDGTTGNSNSLLGNNSFISATSASHNSAIGEYSGAANTTGQYNVYIGAFARGYGSTTESNRFVLNSGNFGAVSRALLVGDFSNRRLGVNMKEDTTLTYTFNVNGNAHIQDSLMVETLNAGTSSQPVVTWDATTKAFRQVAQNTLGGAINNSNIGSNFNWLKPAGQEIKSARQGLYQLIDSATTNTLTFGVDTTNMFPAIRASIAAVGPSTPGGSNTQMQYNNSGSLGGSTMTFTGQAFQVASTNTTQTTTGSIFALAPSALTTGTGLYIPSSTLTSGKLIDLQVSGTAAATGQAALNIGVTGANGTASQITYGLRVSNTHTGTTPVNWDIQADNRMNVGGATNDANHSFIVRGPDNTSFHGLKVTSQNESVSNIIAFNGMNTSGAMGLQANSGDIQMSIATGNGVGVGITPVNTQFHVRAGTTSRAQITLASGALKTTPAAGDIEFVTDDLYTTITTGAARKKVVLADAPLTSGKVPVATTNGRLTDGLIISSGTITPTSSDANVASKTWKSFHYTRVGDVVTFSGTLLVAATSAGATTMTINTSSMVTSNFTLADDAAGTGTDADFSDTGVYIDATASSTNINLRFTAVNTGSHPISFSGHYRVR